MAFTIQNWCRASTSANEPIITLTSGSISGCFRDYNYYTADTQATVAASGYFNAGVTGGGVGTEVVTGDFVNVYSTTSGSLANYRLTNTAGVITSVAVSGAPEATGQLTAAQILGMNAAPVLIANLPAPGAGFAYEIYGLTLNKLVGAAQYANGGAIGLTWGTAGTAATGTIAATMLTGAAATPSYGVAGPIATTGASGASTTFANLGIFITNATAPFITGDSLVNYRIRYRIVSIV